MITSPLRSTRFGFRPEPPEPGNDDDGDGVDGYGNGQPQQGNDDDDDGVDGNGNGQPELGRGKAISLSECSHRSPSTWRTPP